MRAARLQFDENGLAMSTIAEPSGGRANFALALVEAFGMKRVTDFPQPLSIDELRKRNDALGRRLNLQTGD